MLESLRSHNLDLSGVEGFRALAALGFGLLQGLGRSRIAGFTVAPCCVLLQLMLALPLLHLRPLETSSFVLCERTLDFNYSTFRS